jgi:hypothetical protein
MLPTIHLNYQSCLEANKVNDVPTDWNLTAET